MSDLKFQAKVDSKKGEASLKKLDKRVVKVEKSTKKAGAGFKQLAIGVGAGVAAFALASKALRGMIQFMESAIEKSAVQQDAEKKLETVLKSTAEAAGLTKDELLKMASALQDVTTYGDETILGAQSLLLTFTKIGKDVFPDALETVMDMSTALGVDLKQSALSLGKALNDPILGVTALRRVGVSFTEQQTEQIKTLVKSGDVLSAQKLILKELRIEFGGMSRAAVETYSGAVDQMTNVFGDLQEKIGDAVTENEDFRDTIKQITEVTKDLIDSGLVEWVTDIAVEAIKSAPMMESLAKSLALVALIYKIQAEKKKKLDERTVEWIGHLQQEDELQKKLRKDIADNIVVTDEQAVSIKALAGAYESELTFGLRGTSEAAKELARAFALEEIMNKFKEWGIVIPEQFNLVYGGIEKVKTANEKLIESWGLTGEAQLEFSLMAISNFQNMEASLQGFVGAILNTLEQWALGQLIPTIMAALPFPLNLLAVGGATLAIKSIFAGIRGGLESEEPEGYAGGGWAGLQGPEVITVGERGPEFVHKTSDVKQIYDQRAKTISITIIIKDQLDPYTAQRITRQQIIPEILDSLDINENKKKWQERLE